MPTTKTVGQARKVVSISEEDRGRMTAVSEYHAAISGNVAVMKQMEEAALQRIHWELSRLVSKYGIDPKRYQWHPQDMTFDEQEQHEGKAPDGTEG